MPTSLPSNPETQLCLKSVPPVQKPPGFSRPRAKTGPFKKLAILAILMLLAWGCADISQRENPEQTEPVGSIELTATFPSLTGSGASRDAIDAPAIAKPLALEDAPTATAVSLTEVTPDPEPTPIISNIGSEAPPATLFISPTATFRPPATATPTVTPSPPPVSAALLPTANRPPLSPPTDLQPEIKYVVIISVDGMGPEGMETADTLTLDRLRARGAYSGQAQTVPQSVTLISHASMLTGMTPEKHGVQWGLPYIGWPGLNGPSLFSVAHEAGLTTAMVFGKEKLNYLVLPNSVDKLFGDNVHDPEVKEQAVKMIEAGMPDLLFIHFPDVDRVGHDYGWISENQLFAINFVDGLIDEVVAALERGGYLKNTLIIVTADHGGHGFSHGDDCPQDRTIPWLAVGPGVPPGITIASPINTYDTAATALYALGLPIPENWDGRPVLEIFE